ncbi:AAA domain-containing protein [Oryzomonas japonica]|uniref:AAA domain-containing protein n=1 Tax=Oryzomonas japonica TaxID=2603858 RepID=A0A7J4ZNI5_9BACT|nr:sigma 54-interacting transcriptional regulator [Oryzomonas japonica]KAB0664269.1 AAA domain-containing protein [Oryzomonas japonica]
MVNRDDFFREVTIRICSSLDIKTALRNAFDYLKLYFPLDTLSLTIHDVNISSIRRIANVAADNVDLPDEIIAIPKKLWKQIQAWKPIVPTIISSDRDDFFRILAPFIKLEGNSKILVPLLIEGKSLGSLILCARGEGRYNARHTGLLATVATPFAIALANALSYEKLLKYRDRLIDDNHFLNKELSTRAGGRIIGEDSGLKNVLDLVQHVAPLNNTVLLLGETGTGKEVIANAIHFASPRKNGPFIKVNCGAIPGSLIDSELFGHEKGAFTGAVDERRGRFERADGGTIFLDEIAELPPPAQVRLLRVLQNREIERVGGNKSIPVDIRVIAATHRNLENMVSENRFREDLWFRLNVFPIIIPPLRQRKGDIPLLARYFVRAKAMELGFALTPAIAPGAMARLVNYDWPGNVRELENLMEREVILHQGGQLMFDTLLPGGRKSENAVPKEVRNSPAPLRLDEAMALHLSDVMRVANGRIHGPGGAAELLGINPSTLRWRLDKLGIRHGRSKKTSEPLP